MPSYLFFFSVLRSIHIYGVLVLLQMEHCQSKALTTNNRNQTALRAHFATFTCDCFPTIVTNYATIAFRQSSSFFVVWSMLCSLLHKYTALIPCTYVFYRGKVIALKEKEKCNGCNKKLFPFHNIICSKKWSEWRCFSISTCWMFRWRFFASDFFFQTVVAHVVATTKAFYIIEYRIQITFLIALHIQHRFTV